MVRLSAGHPKRGAFGFPQGFVHPLKVPTGLDLTAGQKHTVKILLGATQLHAGNTAAVTKEGGDLGTYFRVSVLP